jgi:hypothetical protein
VDVRALPAEVGDATLERHRGVSSGGPEPYSALNKWVGADRHCRQQQPGNRHSNTVCGSNCVTSPALKEILINAGGRKFSAGVGLPGSPMLPRALCRRPGALAP